MRACTGSDIWSGMNKAGLGFDPVPLHDLFFPVMWAVIGTGSFVYPRRAAALHTCGSSYVRLHPTVELRTHHIRFRRPDFLRLVWAAARDLQRPKSLDVRSPTWLRDKFCKKLRLATYSRRRAHCQVDHGATNRLRSDTAHIDRRCGETHGCVLLAPGKGTGHGS